MTPPPAFGTLLPMKLTSQAPRRAAAGRKPAQRAWRQKNGKAVRSRTACRGRVSL